MTAMVSTLLRDPRGYLLPVGCALLTVAATVCGCARVVNGTVRAEAAGATPAKPIAVADLLIEPTRFPEQYPAVVVDPSIVTRLLRQIDGVPDGSVVTPPECAPLPIAAAEGAAVQGVDQREWRKPDRHGHPTGAARCARGSTSSSAVRRSPAWSEVT